MSLVRYTQDDGSSGEVRILGADKIAWEDSTGGAWYDSALTHRQLQWVTAHAAVREGKWDDVGGFIAHNTDVIPLAGEPGPTQSAASGGP